MFFKRGWVTFVQSCAVPEILTARLVPEFGFLKSLAIDYPPRHFPALKTVGQFAPIARSERLGLEKHAGLQKLYDCIEPHYPVQAAPEVGLRLRASGMKFPQASLRIFIHTYGLVQWLDFCFEVEDPAPESASEGLVGPALARVLNNLERNRGVSIAARTERRPKNVLDVFDQFQRMVINGVFDEKIPIPQRSELFCVFSPECGEYPSDISGVAEGTSERVALFNAIQRFTDRDLTQTLENKCFTSENRVAGSKAPAGWIFGASKGIALIVRPGGLDGHSTRARRCYHKNVARLIGWYRLYQDYLEGPSAGRDGVQNAVLQHAVDALDKMAVRYSPIWIRWARQRFALDRAVQEVVASHNLRRTRRPDDHVDAVPVPPPEVTVEPRLNFSAYPTALGLAMPDQVQEIVTFCLRNTTTQLATVQLKCGLDEYSNTASTPCDLKPGDNRREPMRVKPLSDKVEKLTKAVNGYARVNWQNLQDGSPEREKSFDVTILDKTYFVSARRDKVGEKIVNCCWLIAAWVQRDDPAVTAILKLAASKNDNKMPGYGEPGSGGAEDAVQSQVKALYETLRDKKLAYGNRARPAYQPSNHFGQTVRLPGDLLQQSVLNCLEGAVLFASLLAGCDLDPGILFIPGHALPGWRESRTSGADWRFLEITDVIEADFATALQHGKEAYTGVEDRVNRIVDLGPPDIAENELNNAALLVDIRAIWEQGVKTF